MSCNRLAYVEYAVNIGPHQLVESIGRKILQCLAVLHAGIVDQYVYRASFCLEIVHGNRAGCMISHIKYQFVNCCAFCSQSFSRFIYGLGIPPIQNHFCTSASQSTRQGKTDSAAGTRNQAAFSSKIKHFKRIHTGFLFY
jgi:hypothetical protein